MNKAHQNHCQRIKELRESRGYTQEQLAGISGVSARTIQRIESGDPASLDTLKAIAAAFDLDAADFIHPKNTPTKPLPKPEFFPRVSSGKELVDIVGGVHLYQHDHDPLSEEIDAVLIGDFLQDLKDTGETWDDMEPSYRVECSVRLNSALRELEEAGFIVFGGRVRRRYSWGAVTGETKVIPMEVAVIFVTRESNPEIIRGTLAQDVITRSSVDLERTT